MQWQIFVVQLLEAVAWPVVLVFAIALFRRPIIRLLPTLRSARYKHLELQFGKRLDELGSQAEKADLPEPEARPAWVYESPDEWTFGDYIERLAPISPRMAIAEAWRHVELALRDAASRRGQAYSERRDDTVPPVGVWRNLASRRGLPSTRSAASTQSGYPRT